MRLEAIVEPGRERMREEHDLDEQRDCDPKRAAAWLLVTLTAVAALLAYLYIDPRLKILEAPLFEREIFDAIAHVGNLLGGWRAAPMLVAIALIAAAYRWRTLLLTLVVGYVIQTGSTELIKQFTGRPRPRQNGDPDLFFGWHDGYHSFPSGHASFAFLFATIIGAYFPRIRWLAYSYAVFVSITRVLADAHFVSDVVVGALIGVLSGVVVLRWWPPERVPNPWAKAQQKKTTEPESCAPRPSLQRHAKPRWKGLGLRPLGSTEEPK